jgi:hypothetical protein
MLWQGAPAWKSIALRAMHIRGTAIYFAVLLAWYLESKVTSGIPVSDFGPSFLKLAGAAALTLVLMAVFAWFSARTTVYTITSRRVVIRCGVALPAVLNIPFSQIESANLKEYNDGHGDIALALPSRDRVAYLSLWPHVRPWRFNRAEPMLRGLVNPSATAELLARAIGDVVGGSQVAVTQPERDAPPSKTQQRPRAAAMA